MIRREIAPGIFLTEIEGNYKKSKLSIYLASPLQRETVTATAMLPFLLERGTAHTPDMTLLKRRQNALYGAALRTGYSNFGFARVLEGHISGVDGSLVAGDVSAGRLKLLLEVLFDPCAGPQGFQDDWVDIEREKLRDVIRSVINDKREYCERLLFETLYRDDERALPADGFEEDLAGIDGAGLFDVYKSLVSTSRLEIIYVGSRQPGLTEEVLAGVTSRASGEIKPIAPIPHRPVSEVRRVMELEQTKLAMVFSPGRLLSPRERTVLRVASALLGGAPTSRLFVNVREKLGLCYSIMSMPVHRMGGGLMIECGVDHAQAERTRQAVIAELDQLGRCVPAPREMAEIRLLFENIMRGFYDSSAVLGSYIYGTIVRYGEVMTPEQELKIMDHVTAEEITALMAEMKLDTVCTLTGE